MLGDEFLVRPRLSRIYFKGEYFAYPLQARDVPKRLGLVEATRCVFSYLAASHRRSGTAETFEDWVSVRFGKRLYDAFFRSYTEKVWGIPGSEIRAEWAAQRIKNFSLGKALLTIAGLRREPVTTLMDEFHYPRLGPGQMWEAFRAQVEQSGIPVLLGHRCVGLRSLRGKVRSVLVEADGAVTEHPVDSVVTSIPLAELVLALDPPPPAPVLEAARRLRYRDLCLVALMTNEPEPFVDNWIYLHDPGTRAGRVQNFGAWSPDMVRPGTTCLGVEYFCFQDDEIWEMSEADAIRLATEELGRIGLIDPTRVFGGVKVNVPKAYPMYDLEYVESVAVIRDHLSRFTNLQTCGRNGLHRYNNQDHSMWTAILATLNVLDGASYDVWSVNTEAEYHEEGEEVDTLLALETMQFLETVA
jgi:protoporphyrinogen oxidase